MIREMAGAVNRRNLQVRTRKRAEAAGMDALEFACKYSERSSLSSNRGRSRSGTSRCALATVADVTRYIRALV